MNRSEDLMPGIDEIPERRDEVSLGDLLLEVLRFYQQFGRLLIPLALLLGMLAGVLVAMRPLYALTALLETPQMTLEQWRKLQPMLSDRQLVAASLASMTDLSSEQRERLQRAFVRRKYWDTYVTYRSAVERDDIRQQVNIDAKSVGALGLEVSLYARDDAAANQQLETIAQHVRQVVLWAGVRDYLDSLRQQALEQRPQLQINQIKQRFAIEQNERQAADMQQLLERYPELRRNAVNTVVSVGDGGGRYLSPLAQIVALQSTIAGTRATLRQVERELEQLDGKQRLLERVDQRAPALHLGLALADWVQSCRRAVFGPGNPSGSAQSQVASEIDLALSQQRWRAQQVRYRAIPALSPAPVPSRQPLLVTLAVFLGVLLVASLGLALYVTARRHGDRRASWSAHADPLFAWLPQRMRLLLLGPTDTRPLGPG
ncbi:hypothetical protein MUG10_10105 [Xanthomonas prunicola]|uniref:Polysaccharide chain length determinant N-terminal domain-containing protein n=2 Tax=Xanthomonas prunicola TaxID=2053930 RepID=A0A9Q9MZA1_9XANT|nr:hypothetical protein [Xanthomonas prunicola]USJ02406.1 hypothetical protein MUG10_10105 [Xanthomonas prunicola]UXA50924.1 hypothetical protein M0D44_10830 [Xanthomonas prunicola]UXA67440.1 hypothetical protein M0D43_11095 [Xanthomonas prunicola]